MADLVGVVRQLKAERDQLAGEVKRLDAALAALHGSYGNRGTLSPTARARIAAAQRARWAKVRAGNKSNVVTMTMPKKRTMSAAGRRRIAAAQRARWAKVRAGKKR